MRKAPSVRGKFPTPQTFTTRRNYWLPGPMSPWGRATSNRLTPSPSPSEGASGPWTRTRTDIDHRWNRAPWGSWKPHPDHRPDSAWAPCPPRCRQGRLPPLTFGSLCCPVSAPPCRSTSVHCGMHMWWVAFFFFLQLHITTQCKLEWPVLTR